MTMTWQKRIGAGRPYVLAGAVRGLRCRCARAGRA